MAEVRVHFTTVKGYRYPKLPIPWDLNEKFSAKPGEPLKCKLVGRCLIYYRNEEELTVSAKQLAEQLGLSLEAEVSANRLGLNEEKVRAKRLELTFEEFKEKLRELAERGDEDASRLLKRWDKESSVIRSTFNVLRRLALKD